MFLHLTRGVPSGEITNMSLGIELDDKQDTASSLFEKPKQLYYKEIGQCKNPKGHDDIILL